MKIHIFNRSKNILRRVPKIYYEITAATLIILIFAMKSASYSQLDALSPPNIINTTYNGYVNITHQVSKLKYFQGCSKGMVKVEINQQYLCRAATTTSIYQKIFDTYPRDPAGREIIYALLDEGSVSSADRLMSDQYFVSNYTPAIIKQPLTWTEDPYHDSYWRMNFYSLRVFKDLLYAARTTNNPSYTNHLLTIINSFIDTGMNQPHAWDDSHAVAWRSMLLVNIWWKLRSMNALPIDTSNKILAAIEKHATYLAKPEHYEQRSNNGADEAAALYLIGASFPDLTSSAQWLNTGKTRLDTSINDLVHNDGALVENSPYYQFYVLEKYWEISKYSVAQNKQISINFDQKIKAMIKYATYVLQPNLHVPILGDSLDRQVLNHPPYTEMANIDPEFKYVMTKGLSGQKPANNMQFKDVGQTIMRSGWDPANYTDQTQAIFSYGGFNNPRSHLDALNLVLYGGGISLLPGPGIYTYNKGPYFDYFTGTSASNTVLVDQTSQLPGTGVAGQFIDQSDYASQSASEQLNNGVTHERQVTMIGQKIVLVIDKLHSDSEHTYQQLFHLFPGANYSTDGLTAVAQGQQSQQRLEINQLSQDGMTLGDVVNEQSPNHLAGICSVEYEKIVPCRQATYTKKAKDATFVTMLKIGKPDSSINSQLANDNTVRIQQSGKTYTINLQETPGKDTVVTASDNKALAPTEEQVFNTDNTNGWFTTNGVVVANSDSSGAVPNSIMLTGVPGTLATTKKFVNLDLSNKNLLFRIKVPNVANIQNLDLVLYSKNGSYAQSRLLNIYDIYHDNQWLTIGLGKGLMRSEQGQWSVYGSDFDWSSISAVGFRVSSKDTNPANILFGPLSQYPEQTEGKVAIVFDDGYLSVLPAVSLLDKYNYKASVAVIGMYPARQDTGYLSVADLKKLKDKGWSIVNHSYYHTDAVAAYTRKNDLMGYEKDILKGAIYLSDNGLVTDENWYVDPHGSSNNLTENIIKKYYKFKRTTQRAPEVYPFGNAMNVKAFGVQNDTTVDAVKSAIDDANTYHQTLFLTFHRLHSSDVTKPGYNVDQFGQIVDYLAQTKSNVMSLNQLDDSNGVTQNHLSIQRGYPAQLSVEIKQEAPAALQGFVNFLNH